MARDEMRRCPLGLEIVNVKGCFKSFDIRARLLKGGICVAEIPEVKLRAAEAHERPRLQRRTLGPVRERESFFGEIISGAISSRRGSGSSGGVLILARLPRDLAPRYSLRRHGQILARRRRRKRNCAFR